MIKNQKGKYHLSDITNKRFGKLIAIELDTNKSGFGLGSFWKCKCDCGDIKTISYSCLAQGMTESCGCINACGPTHPQFKGIGDMPSTYYSNAKRQAKERQIQFNVSKEYLWDLFLKQNRKCALSGLELQFRKHQHIADGTASLDRIDSTKGYTEGNVQWIHKEINFMKQAKTDTYFIEMCKLVASYHN